MEKPEEKKEPQFKEVSMENVASALLNPLLESLKAFHSALEHNIAEKEAYINKIKSQNIPE
jgi:hypothetical protein